MDDKEFKLRMKNVKDYLNDELGKHMDELFSSMMKQETTYGGAMSVTCGFLDYSIGLCGFFQAMQEGYMHEKGHISEEYFEKDRQLLLWAIFQSIDFHKNRLKKSINSGTSIEIEVLRDGVE